jgi:hypothetical protein
LVPLLWKSNSLVKELPQVKVAEVLMAAPDISRSQACVVVRLPDVREVPVPELGVATASRGELEAIPLYS